MKILKATILNIDKKNKNGRIYSRDILEDSTFKLLLLVGKLDNIIIMGDKIH